MERDTQAIEDLLSQHVSTTIVGATASATRALSTHRNSQLICALASLADLPGEYGGMPFRLEEVTADEGVREVLFVFSDHTWSVMLGVHYVAREMHVTLGGMSLDFVRRQGGELLLHLTSVDLKNGADNVAELDSFRTLLDAVLQQPLNVAALDTIWALRENAPLKVPDEADLSL